jgi:hypothetical protein
MLVAAVCGGGPKRLRKKIQDHPAGTKSIKIRYSIEIPDTSHREIADAQRKDPGSGTIKPSTTFLP